jgi:hypothetical protein
MTGLTRRLTSGAIGAVGLTILHELARRRVTNAPRMDLMGMRALRRMSPQLHQPHMSSERLHTVALAGDLVCNSIYYAAIPGRTPTSTWTRAAVLGLAAGCGALLLPEPMGLGPPPHSDRRSNQAMTVAWYAAGAAATALAATAIGQPSPSGSRLSKLHAESGSRHPLRP